MGIQEWFFFHPETETEKKGGNPGPIPKGKDFVLSFQPSIFQGGQLLVSERGMIWRAKEAEIGWNLKQDARDETDHFLKLQSNQATNIN